MRHNILVALATMAMMTAAPAMAQTDLGLWGDASAEFNLSKKWEVDVEAGLRTEDGLSTLNRWSLGASADFSPIKMLSIGAGYTFIDTHYDSYTTAKGNIVDDYWRIRNRVFGQVKLKFRPSILKVDLRLRYQMTHKSEVSIAKYSSAGARKSNEVKEADNENLFRSRLSLGFKTKTRLTPSVSYELFNDLGDSFTLDKQRLTIGTDIKLNKHNFLTIGYVRNIYSGDDDDDKTHNAIMIGYKIKL